MDIKTNPKSSPHTTKNKLIGGILISIGTMCVVSQIILLGLSMFLVDSITSLESNVGHVVFRDYIYGIMSGGYIAASPDWVERALLFSGLFLIISGGFFIKFREFKHPFQHAKHLDTWRINNWTYYRRDRNAK